MFNMILPKRMKIKTKSNAILNFTYDVKIINKNLKEIIDTNYNNKIIAHLYLDNGFRVISINRKAGPLDKDYLEMLEFNYNNGFVSIKELNFDTITIKGMINALLFESWEARSC